jgi:hypothetical protein
LRETTEHPPDLPLSKPVLGKQEGRTLRVEVLSIRT